MMGGQLCLVYWMAGVGWLGIAGTEYGKKGGWLR